MRTYVYVYIAYVCIAYVHHYTYMRVCVSILTT